ncbi:MAG: hypothetical protein ACXVB0_01770 [Mucilaginibacter sp.]
MKDVIEHIYQNEKLLAILKANLTPFGFIFLGFPPWRMPFGGHQQVCRSKFLSPLPGFHLLPANLYKAVLSALHEEIDFLVGIRQIGLSIRGFEKLAKLSGFNIVGKEEYLINPIYEFKFGIKPIPQSLFISRIPYIKDYFTT